MTDPDAVDPQSITTRQEFAQALTLLRTRAGLTVRDVAKSVGIPFQTVGDYFGGRHLPPRTSDVLKRILGVCGVDEPTAVTAWTEALQRIRRAPGPRPRASVTPYLGLSAFQPEHADWFFGREQLTEVLLERLTTADGLVIAVGASGSGKSSLLRAGLIPAARAGRLALAEGSAPRSWTTVLLTPGERPAATLAAALAKANAAADADPDVHTDTDADDDAPGLLVIIDQFEELFAACPDETERQAFLTALDELATSGPLASPPVSADASGRPVALVAAMRADFYPHALRYEQLVPALQHRQVVVGPMSTEELRRAIAEPARRVKADVEPGLVELMLADIAPMGPAGTEAHEAGALPLLSHALLSTWERGGHRAMTVAAYRDSGGIAHAVAQSAEDVYDALDDEQRERARGLFLRLVQVAPDMADTRRRVPRSELETPGTDETRGAPELAPVVELFVQHRLLSADETHVEIAHEALLRAWPRLVGWIDADRAGLRIHRQLTEAAAAWQDADRDAASLYRGTRLDLARDWAADPEHEVLLNHLERDFLDASIAHESARQLVERRRTRRLVQLVAALGALLLVALGLGTFAAVESAAREHERDLAVSRQIAITANDLRATDVALAAQLSLAAYRIAPTPEARASLLEAYAQPTVTRLTSASGYLQVLAASADGRLLATGDVAGAIQLYDTSVTPAVRLTTSIDLHAGTLFGLAFRPDGRLLASVGADRTVRLWDLADPAQPRVVGEVNGGEDTLYAVAFSPDGVLLATASNDQTLRLWDVSDPENPRATATVPAAASLHSVAFRPDGQLLAAGAGDGSVNLHDISDPLRPVAVGAPLAVAESDILALAFAPDGQTLATGGQDNQVRLWDVRDPGGPVLIGEPLTGAESWINALAFSSDGTTLAAASSDTEVWLWHVATGTLIRRLPHPAPVTSAAFLAGSGTVATAAADGTTRVWSVTAPVAAGPTKGVYAVGFLPGARLAAASGDDDATIWNIANPRAPVWDVAPFTAPGEYDEVGSSAVSPDGSRMVLGTREGPVELWDITTDPPTPQAMLTGPTDLIESLAFSPDGRHVVAGTDDTRAYLWDVEDPNTPGRPLAGHTNYIYVAAFSPDGRTVATASIDGTGRLWDVSDPADAGQLGDPFLTTDTYVTSVGFSPDGRLLAAGDGDSGIWLYDVTDRDHPRLIGARLPGPHGYVLSVAFSPDSRTLAAGGTDGDLWLYDVSDPAEPQHLASIDASTASIYGLGFDPQRPTLLASSGIDPTIRFWETDPERVAADVCATVGDPVTEEEWRRYVPGTDLALPCLS